MVLRIKKGMHVFFPKGTHCIVKSYGQNFVVLVPYAVWAYNGLEGKGYRIPRFLFDSLLS